MISLRSKVTKNVLNYFFIHEHKSLYVNEMARLFKLDRANLIRKLRELERENILLSEFRGNQKYFMLNKKYTLFNEYKRIILKTIGLEEEIRQLLKNVKGAKGAYLFGSYAQDKLNAASDIDLLVIGGQDTIKLQKAIAPLQKKISREINVISISEKEFLRKRKHDPFIKGVLNKEKIKLL